MKLSADMIYAISVAKVIDDPRVEFEGVSSWLFLAVDQVGESIIAFTASDDVKDSVFYESVLGTWGEVVHPWIESIFETELKALFPEVNDVGEITDLFENTIDENGEHLFYNKRLLIVSPDECVSGGEPLQGYINTLGIWIISAEVELQIDSKKKTLKFFGEKLGSTEDLMAHLLDFGTQQGSLLV